jgi:HD-GYP domain-containing protein (c-di-GMP phosphodiesterase class II)/ActR/RegA family two-component response regulator
MPSNVLIVQEDPKITHTLTDIFERRGDRVGTATCLRAFGTVISNQVPDLIVADVHLFGKKWPLELPSLTQRLPNTRFLFTTNSSQLQHESAIKAYEKWGVLRAPFTTYSIERALHVSSEEEVPASKDLALPVRVPNVRVPLLAKITLPILAVALFISLAAAFVTTQIILDTSKTNFSGQLTKAGTQAAEWIVWEESQNLELLRILANTRGLSEAVVAGDAEQLREMVYPVAVNAAVEAVEILDAGGTSLLSMRHLDGGQIEEYLVSRGDETFGQWDYVRNVIGGRSDEIGNKYAGLSVAPWGAYLYVAGPILDEGDNLVGALLVGESLVTIVQRIRDATLAHITVYSLDGNPLATTFEGVSPWLSSSMAADVLDRQDTESYLRQLVISDATHGEILRPLEVRAGSDVGLIGTALPQTSLASPSIITRIQIFAFSAVIVLLVISIGFFVADRIKQPVQRMIWTATEVAQGNLKVDIDEVADDELGALAVHFNHMVSVVQRSNTDLQNAFDVTIEGWSKALELRDHHSKGHIKRVTEMTLLLAREMGLDDEELMHVRRGAMLHDIGELAVPEAIINKPGPLTEKEWEIMRRHPLNALRMLSPIDYLRPALDIPCCHHERWDGAGYPYGLKGKEIPLPARIFTVVDVWDALRCDRPFRRALPEDKVIGYIRVCRAKQFDPIVVDLFMELVLGVNVRGKYKEVVDVKAVEAL